MLTRWRTRRDEQQRREQEVADALARHSVLAQEATALRADLAATHAETIGAIRAVLARWGHDRDGTVAGLVAELRQALDGQAEAVRRG